MTCRSRSTWEWYEIVHHAMANGYFLKKRKVHANGHIEPVHYYVYSDGDGRKHSDYKSPSNGYRPIILPKKLALALFAYATLKQS